MYMEFLDEIQMNELSMWENKEMFVCVFSGMHCSALPMENVYDTEKDFRKQPSGETYVGKILWTELTNK